MRITSVRIVNFKSLRHLQLNDLPELVVIAGPNGSGKTALFDALRVWKEAIAGYSLRSPGSVSVYNLLQQIGPVVTIGEAQAEIVVTIRVTEAERKEVELPDDHSGELMDRVTIPRPYAPGQSENAQPDYTHSDLVYLKRLLGERYSTGGKLGVINHIGPDRRFTNTQAAGISFSIDYAESEMQKLVLNSNDKFGSLAQDILTMHMVDLQERDQGVQEPHYYIEGIRKIFRHFLPDKEFIGVKFLLILADQHKSLWRVVVLNMTLTNSVPVNAKY